MQSVDSANNKQIEDHVNNVDNENAINPHLECTSASPMTQYHPQESFNFPKSTYWKTRTPLPT